MKYHDIQLTGSLQVTGSLAIPTGTTAERPANPKSGSIRLNSSNGRVEIYTAVSGAAWEVVGAQTQVSTVASADVEYLVVAGGGGGGGWGGGGGAGGLLSSSLSSVESGSTFTITVGGGAAGGQLSEDAGTYVQGGDGTDTTIESSTITTITATGGGGGGRHNSYTIDNGRDGGSGGGCGMHASADNVVGGGSGGSGTTGQGNSGGGGGGSSTSNSVYYRGGGGGGAGTAGEDGTGHNSGGNGGDGKASKITGTSTYYAGGGGSHTDRRSGASVTSGGLGGGGAGGGYQTDTHAEDGTANTGGGGGGSYGYANSHQGGGGSGVVILAYPTSSVNGAGGITGTTSAGKKYHQFYTSDTFKLGSSTDFVIPSSILNKAVIHVDAGNFASRGTSTWTDLKGNANGTVSGATLGTNIYYDFDGSNDYIDFGDNAATSRTGAFGFDLWIKMDSGHTGTSPVHKEQQYSIDIDSSMNIRYADSSTWSYATFGSTASGVSTDTWFHWAVTKDSSNVVTMWINGSSVVSKSFGSAITDTANELYLGTYDNTSSYTNGKIAQFRLYNNSLTTAEVLQIYNATKTNFV